MVAYIQPLPGAPALAVESLRKVFPGRRGVVAVEDASFAVDAGEIVGLLGPNGAGKTTIIKCALGLVRPTAGRATVFGHDVRRNAAGVLANAAAVLEGSRNVYWRLTPWENASFFASLNGLPVSDPATRRYLEAMLERFGLGPVKNSQVRELSTGFKQKTAVVSALARRTPLVFLDEPTLGLDVETSLELRSLLREMVAEEGRTVVLSSHDMDVVQDVCRRVVVVSGGRVIADQDVEGLLDLFRSRRYRLVLDGPVAAETREYLERLDSQVSVEASPAGTTVQIQLNSAAQLYELVDLVRRSGLLIETIVQSEPDLEQAFLELVRKERAPK